MSTLLAVVGRVLIALLFIVSGVNKFADISGTQAMLTAAHLPASLAIPTAIFEVVAGLALVFGVLTRLFAILLAGFCLLTAFFFHNQFMDPIQAANLLKNIAIAGGLLCLSAAQTWRWSYDDIRDRRRRELALRDAQLREERVEGTLAEDRLKGHRVG